MPESARPVVIVAVDLSDTSREAMAWAFDYALRTNCDLRLLHVIDRTTTAQKERGAIERAAEAELEHSIPDAETRRRLGAPARCVAWGKPADQIVRVARKLGAEMVVMGTHGRCGWKRARLGSVAEMVVRHAPCTVTCVKPKQTA